MTVWEFARRPRWIVSHAIVAAVAITFVFLGFWQLHRLDERRSLNDDLTSRADATPLTPAEVAGLEPDEARFRRVSSTGRYRLDQQVRIGNQSQQGQPGEWILVPFEADDGTVIAVSRGFVPRGQVDDIVSYAPVAETVTIEALAFPTASGGRVAADAAGPAGPEISRIDLAAAREAIGVDLGSVYLQIQSESPDPGDLPFVVPPPELGEGPHLSYAIQWYLFASMGLVAYGLVLRKVARADQSKGDVAVPWDL